MSELVWYRSLYWRIAFGFIALLAVLLVVQAGLFLFLTGRILSSSRSPAELANEVADAVSFELSRTPDLAIEPWLQARYGDEFQPFLVVLTDGRAGSNRPNALPPNFGRLARARGRWRGEFGGGREQAPAGRAESDRPFRRGPGRVAELAPVLVNGTQVGVVAVPANRPPMSVALREVGPMLGWVAAGLLIAGAAVMALVIFRPARQRLRALEQAAAALGAGRTRSARSPAPSTGWRTTSSHAPARSPRRTPLADSSSRTCRTS
jgi:hypothetical protein